MRYYQQRLPVALAQLPENAESNTRSVFFLSRLLVGSSPMMSKGPLIRLLISWLAG
jgi:hypothetical protein